MFIKHERVPRVLPVHIYIYKGRYIIYLYICINTTMFIKHERVPRVLPVHIYINVDILYICTYMYK